MSLYLILAAFGTLAGFTTLLFGFGGGFVIVPLLYQGLLATHGADSAAGAAAMHIAIATSTCVMVASAGMATRRRLAQLQWNWLWPLAAYIGLGAFLGAGLATLASGKVLRWAFLIYLAITIADCLLRKGFMHGASPAPWGEARRCRQGWALAPSPPFLAWAAAS
ncbi:Sulfite exporter TauE/SafE [Bordetella trematum]|nr:Sulfite exporter TauE/SafE [Bordetella trematum]